MARRNSSLGFFGMFGRSSDLRQLDAALRARDLHPALVPEGAKLTIVNLMKDEAADGEPPAHAYPYVAGLVAYCLVGGEAFEIANGREATLEVERRIEAALGDGESFDARMILLAIHARLIEPGVVERYGLAAEGE